MGARSFRIVCWNIAGVGNVEKAWNFLGRYDIIALQETWLEESKIGDWWYRLNKEYNWTFKGATREKRKGRAKGGVLLGVKKILSVRKVKEWEWGIVVEGLKIESEKRINLVVIYNNGKMEEMIKSLSKLGEELSVEGEGLLIMGDLNARIGDWQVGTRGERERSRTSWDKTINRAGEKLLELCEELGGTIRNGNTKGDWEGRQTFVGDGGNSVLDLVIEVEKESGSIIEELEIVPRIESDHLPISLTCRGKTWESREYEDKEREEEERMRWDERRREEYKLGMAEKADRLDMEVGGGAGKMG